MIGSGAKRAHAMRVSAPHDMLSLVVQSGGQVKSQGQPDSRGSEMRLHFCMAKGMVIKRAVNWGHLCSLTQLFTNQLWGISSNFTWVWKKSSHFPFPYDDPMGGSLLWWNKDPAHSQPRYLVNHMCRVTMPCCEGSSSLMEKMSTRFAATMVRCMIRYCDILATCIPQDLATFQ